MSKYDLLGRIIACFCLFWTQNDVFAQQKNYLPITLKSVDEIVVSASSERATPQATLNISARDSAFIRYWQFGAVIRWNIYVRELVGMYNVSPVLDRATQSYPVPNPQKPADLPRFPYCNPPYAARVFAYTSVAQLDAMLVAKHYQTKFGRPSYPATEAAMATAIAEVLKTLFPAELQGIGEKLAEYKKYMLLSGVCSESDWLAGANVGATVGQKVALLSENDGMKAALETPQNEWRSMEKSVRAKKEVAWRSLQNPPRPPIDPFFGQVKRWLGGDMATLRPEPPISPTSTEFKKQLQVIKDSTRLFDDHKTFTVGKWSDGDWSPTPIGHWNATTCDLIKSKKTSELDAAFQLSWLNRALMDAAIVTWDAKYFYFYPRPSQIDSSLTPKLKVPNFPSYPSGHAAFSIAAANILTHFYPSEQATLSHWAHEASMSRVFAAIHYPMDCKAGETIGEKISAMALKQIK